MKAPLSAVVIDLAKRRKKRGGGTPNQVAKPQRGKIKRSRKPTGQKAFDADVHFWPRVDTSAGPEACHLWTGHIDQGNGYGRIWDAKGLPYAHRKSWEVANGRIVPAGKHVLHDRGCSKLCCSSDHLRLGSRFENSADAKAEGKLGKRLTPEQAKEIARLRLERGRTYSQIAAKFGVSNQTVFQICKGRSWSKLTGISRPSVRPEPARRALGRMWRGLATVSQAA